MNFENAIKKLFSLTRIDVDNFPTGAIYQCVDPVKWVLNKVFKLPYGSYGNAIEYWTHPHPNITKTFKRVNTRTAKKGDLVVIKGILGHIGWATGRNKPGYTEITEQNGSKGYGLGTYGDAIRNRYVPNSSIAGIWRPKEFALIMAKFKSTPKKKPKSTPSKSYAVIRAIPAYYTSSDAKKKTKRKGTVKAGKYSVFNKANGMINVTQESGIPGAWINPADNKRKKSKPKPKAKKKYHKAKRGDTVDKISKKYGLKIIKHSNVQKRYPGFKKLNPKVKNVNNIKAGEKYRVK